MGEKWSQPLTTILEKFHGSTMFECTDMNRISRERMSSQRSSEGRGTQPWVSGDRTGDGWRGGQGPCSPAVSVNFVPLELGEHLWILNRGRGKAGKCRKVLMLWKQSSEDSIGNKLKGTGFKKRETIRRDPLKSRQVQISVNNSRLSGEEDKSRNTWEVVLLRHSNGLNVGVERRNQDGFQTVDGRTEGWWEGILGKGFQVQRKSALTSLSLDVHMKPRGQLRKWAWSSRETRRLDIKTEPGSAEQKLIWQGQTMQARKFRGDHCQRYNSGHTDN